MQSSPLFIRVSSPHDSRVVILARKFPLPAFSQHSRQSAQVAPRRSAAGFTLIEAMAASSLFASVIVAVVFPTLVVLAHADRIATQHERALQIASNALADEEAALAYGYVVKDGSVVSTVDGMKLSETMSAAGIPGLHNLTVDVSDARGHSLAAIATQVGPPVPPPGAPSPAPSYPATR